LEAVAFGAKYPGLFEEAEIEIGKVHPVLDEIGEALGFIPCDQHNLM
jgi:hypothetical protein